MDKFSRNKQNLLSFYCIYNFLTLIEINEIIDAEDILTSQCDLQYDEIDTFIKENLIRSIINYEKIKETISSNLVNWKYERISIINRSILFFGLVNGLFIKDLEKKLIIDICVSFAKKFSENNDYKFINAILDKVL